MPKFVQIMPIENYWAVYKRVNNKYSLSRVVCLGLSNEGDVHFLDNIHGFLDDVEERSNLHDIIYSKEINPCPSALFTAQELRCNGVNIIEDEEV